MGESYLDYVLKEMSSGFSIELILNRKDYDKKTKDLKRLAERLQDNLVMMSGAAAEMEETKEGYRIVAVAFPEKKLKYVLGEFLPNMGVKEESIQMWKDHKRLDMKDVKKKFL